MAVRGLFAKQVGGLCAAHGFESHPFRQILKLAERMDETVLLEGSDTRLNGVPASKGLAIGKTAGALW